jgi:hypothetical protein
MNTLKLDVSKMTSNFNPDDWDKIYQLAFNGIEINAEDSPCPWDAGLKVEGDNIVLFGGAGPSGWGRCEVIVPKTTIMGAYEFSITAKGKVEERELIKILSNVGITIVNQQDMAEIPNYNSIYNKLTNLIMPIK